MPVIKKQLPPAAPGLKAASVGFKAAPHDWFESAVEVSQLAASGLKVLVFGVSGTGKTTFACTFPKPLFLIRPEEVEDGSISVRNVAGVFTGPPITDVEQLDQIIQGQRRTNRYKTIVLDGITRLQDHVVKKHMGLQDVPVQQTYGGVPQADWNLIGISMKEHLRDLLKLADTGTNVVLVGGERTVGESDNKNVVLPNPMIMVALSPGTSGFVHETCDYNFHSFKRRKVIMVKKTVMGKEVNAEVTTDKMEFCLHIDAHELYGTKFRKPKDKTIPEVLSDPNYDKVAGIIKEVFA